MTLAKRVAAFIKEAEELRLALKDELGSAGSDFSTELIEETILTITDFKLRAGGTLRGFEQHLSNLTSGQAYRRLAKSKEVNEDWKELAPCNRFLAVERMLKQNPFFTPLQAVDVVNLYLADQL